jgi:hypothetical protein
LWGVIAFARGALVIILAMLYVLLAVGMFVEKSWAWWVGLIVCAINFLLVINVVVQGESVSRAGFWLIAPIIIAAYLGWALGGTAITRRTGVCS